MKRPIGLHLSVQFASRSACPDRAQIRRWVTAALRMAKTRRPAAFVVRFCDAREARQLNRQFRGRDYATNVLTFAYGDQNQYRADVVLCVAVLKREARAQDIPVKDHTAHLVVHGILHALGYDHDTAQNARVMETLEGAILARFAIPDPYAV